MMGIEPRSEVAVNEVAIVGAARTPVGTFGGGQGIAMILEAIR